MNSMQRRVLLAAAVSLPVAAGPGKSRAEGLPDLSRLQRTDAVLPTFKFLSADGAARSMADYAGQPVVLNLWATWCVPCIVELPALDSLARQMAGQMAVLALSSDRGGAAPVERFYKERGIETLSVLLDPRGDAARALGARGIPTTVLIDRAGRERGRVEGAADWSSPASVALIRQVVGG